MVDLFTEDAKALQHEESALIGRTAIGQTLTELLAMVDTAALEVDYDIVDVHDDRAYVLAIFQETLRPKDGVAPPSTLTDGWCAAGRDEDGKRRVARLLTSRAST